MKVVDFVDGLEVFDFFKPAEKVVVFFEKLKIVLYRRVGSRFLGELQDVDCVDKLELVEFLDKLELDKVVEFFLDKLEVFRRAVARQIFM